MSYSKSTRTTAHKPHLPERGGASTNPTPRRREEPGRGRSSHLSPGRQLLHAVRLEEGEVDHGLEQGDGLLGVTGLAQEVTLLKKERCEHGQQRARTLVSGVKGKGRSL